MVVPTATKIRLLHTDAVHAFATVQCPHTNAMSYQECSQVSQLWL
jgi:hypothetical protein